MPRVIVSAQAAGLSEVLLISMLEYVVQEKEN